MDIITRTGGAQCARRGTSLIHRGVRRPSSRLDARPRRAARGPGRTSRCAAEKRQRRRSSGTRALGRFRGRSASTFAFHSAFAYQARPSGARVFAEAYPRVVGGSMRVTVSSRLDLGSGSSKESRGQGPRGPEAVRRSARSNGTRSGSRKPVRSAERGRPSPRPDHAGVRQGCETSLGPYSGARQISASGESCSRAPKRPRTTSRIASAFHDKSEFPPSGLSRRIPFICLVRSTLEVH